MKDIELMSKIVDRFKIEPGLILLHHNADIDAVGSALALKNAFPSFSIGAFQKISQKSKKLINYFEDIEILQPPELDKFKTVVILDASTPSQLGISQDVLNNPIIIDHHVSNNVWDSEFYYCDDSKSSCAELIFELLEFIDFQITQKTALALSVAILADTGHFKYANPDSFINFAQLMKLGNLTMADVLKLVEENDQLEMSQRIAHLKGAQRLKYQQINGYFIAVSILSSYEAIMCKYLLTLGADVAFVGAQHDENIRISGRASKELVQKGLHLGEFFQGLSTELSCEGGGHAGAAGINGTGDVEMVLNVCMNKMSEILKEM
jgi:nanoRNase/pAp phosphatase (c-di-AMP/oligoRNAs hydrolase)